MKIYLVYTLGDKSVTLSADLDNINEVTEMYRETTRLEKDGWVFNNGWEESEEQ